MNLCKLNSYIIVALVILISILLYSCNKADTIVNPPTNSGAAGKFSKTYGAGGSDVFTSMASASDGYVLAGYTISFGAGDNDFYAVKISNAGDVSWSKTFGGTGSDVCNSVIKTSDGGFLLVGNRTSTETIGTDIYVVKIDASGNPAWSGIYKIAGDQFGNSVVQDADNGFVICGYTNQNAASNNDVLIMKIGADGAFQWQKLYGEQFNDFAYKIIKTSDGGFLAAGVTYNFASVLGDIYLIKLKSDATLDWSKTYGSTDYDQVNDVIETAGHDFMIAGYTKSFGLTAGDMIMFKTDHSGNVYTTEGWPRTLGFTAGIDEATSVVQASDGSFCFTGYLTNAAGDEDIFFAHYYANSEYDYSRSYGTAGNDKGSVIITKSDGYLIGGTSASFGAGGNDFITVGLKTGSDGKAGTCITDNTPVPNGGSPTGFDGVTAATVLFTGTGAEWLPFVYANTSQSTSAATQCTEN